MPLKKVVENAITSISTDFKKNNRNNTSKNGAFKRKKSN
jgi:hypothetical protein